MGEITVDILLLIGIFAFTDIPVNASCPLEMNPVSVVARYGDSVSVNCSTSSTDHGGMGWEAEIGASHSEGNVKFVTWIVETLNAWGIKPECYINLPSDSQSRQTLSVTLYKEPDSVSISQSSHTGPMVEGTAYQLQCDVISVAPVRNLTVIWYKEHNAIHMQSYDNLTVFTPVNESSTLTITPHRDDNGALIYCEARMNLGPSGPSYFPVMRSKSHVMTVYYPPTIFSSESAGRLPGAGTTARIVVVFLALNCFVSVCVVYHKRKNTPQGSGHLKEISLS